MYVGIHRDINVLMEKVVDEQPYAMYVEAQKEKE